MSCFEENITIHHNIISSTLSPLIKEKDSSMLSGDLSMCKLKNKGYKLNVGECACNVCAQKLG